MRPTGRANFAEGNLMRLRRLAIVAVLAAAALAAATNPSQATTPKLHFSKAYVNSPGSDTGTNTSLNAEYIKVTNSSTTSTYTLTGYTIRDKSAHVYKFPTFKLKPGASVNLHTGSGTNTTTNLYWKSKAYIWNNSGDSAYLRNSAGTAKDSCTWKTVASYVAC
jgi:Lamin Tail Domain